MPDAGPIDVDGGTIVPACFTSSQCGVTERCVELRCQDAVEGSRCSSSEACPGALYCADVCQDGSTGDRCNESSDCMDAAELCDMVCRARESGEECGPGDTCPDDLRCVDSICRAGETGDPCSIDDDCFQAGEQCQGDPAVCTPVVTFGEACDDDTPCARGLSCSNDVCAPQGFVYVPAGTFDMGSPGSELGRLDIEGPVHPVTLTGALLLADSEVTQAQWLASMGTAPASFDACGDDCPVERIGWYDALAYLNALSVEAGLPECYDLSDCSGTAGVDFDCTDVRVDAPGGLPYLCEGYRLPTEAEWEYAYRAGTSTAFYDGDITLLDCASDPLLDPIAWYCGNAGGTPHPVKQKDPNPWGLFDMPGNVSEWVWDGYDAGYYARSPAEDPQGAATRSALVTRGGSWEADAQQTRAAQRFVADVTTRNAFIGFRVARTFPVDDTCVEDGVCERRRENAASCPADCATLGEPCDPFEPLPASACEAPFWCQPSAEEVGIDGVCADAKNGGLEQGALCTDASDCAPGFDCPAALLECVRYCDRALDPDATCGGAQLQCQEALDSDAQPLDVPYGYCRETCDFDAGLACPSDGRSCTAGEIVSTGRDLCFDAAAFSGSDSWLDPGDDCTANGFAEDAFCGGINFCISDTCTAHCRLEVGMIDVVGHPDCGATQGCSDFYGDMAAVGVCEQRCTSLTPMLGESFNGETFRGNLTGNAILAGWADFDFPNIADDEATGGTDGDAGIALQGWLAGDGTYSFNQEAIDVISIPGMVFYAGADVHVEPGFNPSSFSLSITWFNAMGFVLDTDSLDLLPLTPGNVATDHAEWFRVGLESVRPEDAASANVIVHFANTFDIGGLQAARIDNVTFGTCNN